MRILHYCVLIFAFAILLKNVYCDSSNNPLPNSPLSYCSSLPKPKASSLEVAATNTKLGKVHPQAPAPPPSPTLTSCILALHWPPGACCGPCHDRIDCRIRPVPTEFTINGFWTQPLNLPIISNETFGNQLATITSELNKNWPNLRSAQQQVSDNLMWWRQRWNNDGSRFEMGVLDYFKKALELFGDAGQGLKGKLVAQGIKPTLSATYKRTAIEAALNEIFGFSCRIICNERAIGPRWEQQIQEIQFEFTPDFKKRNRRLPSRCGDPNADADVLFPSLV